MRTRGPIKDERGIDGGGKLSQNWFVMPGTYKEVSGR
jgi:hypothetical protein